MILKVKEFFLTKKVFSEKKINVKTIHTLRGLKSKNKHCINFLVRLSTFKIISLFLYSHFVLSFYEYYHTFSL